MNTSLKWIKALVPGLDCGVQEYVDAMTLSGSKVEGYEQLDADLDKIVVGQVTKIEKHPDADKLVICQVNVGSETLQIVTGAPNVFEGAKVPVVLDGGRVAGGHDGTKTPGGIKIKKGKLRGVESSGMMCSIEELGSNREMFPDAPENGLYIFDEPEAALSPVNQLVLVRHICRLVKEGSQFLISTHSPVLLCIPGAQIYELSREKGRSFCACQAEETALFRFYSGFMRAPHRVMQELLKEE